MLGVGMLLVAAGCGDESPPAAASPSPTVVREPTATAERAPSTAALRRLEARHDARLGVYALDTGTGRELAYHADDRFPFASTFKALAAAALLREVGVDGLRRTVPIEQLVNAYSPVTERRVGTRMSLAALASAAVRYSDNTAANLLLDELGGPKGLDAILAEEGDDVTRMERPEPDLNVWQPGQLKDTSTPRALAGSLRTFVLGDALDEPERAQLTKWLRTNTTGGALIRAGVPDDWTVGDKTGTGATYGARNDIAVLWPPDRDPIVLAIMTRGRAADAEPDDALVAAAAKATIAALG